MSHALQHARHWIRCTLRGHRWVEDEDVRGLVCICCHKHMSRPVNY
jgi:hypothetical protein